MLTAIISITTDHTNVYGYVNVEVLRDGEVLENGYDKLPSVVQNICNTQHPSTYCRSVSSSGKEAADILKRLGWNVLNDNCEPYFKE